MAKRRTIYIERITGPDEDWIAAGYQHINGVDLRGRGYHALLFEIDGVKQHYCISRYSVDTFEENPNHKIEYDKKTDSGDWETWIFRMRPDRRPKSKKKLKLDNLYGKV